MPTSTFHKGMTKRQVAHNTAIFNVILSNEKNALMKGITHIGKISSSLWASNGSELLKIYNESREKIVDRIAKINLSALPSDFNLFTLVKNGYTGVSEWKDDELIGFAMDNYDKLEKTDTVLI